MFQKRSPFRRSLIVLSLATLALASCDEASKPAGQPQSSTAGSGAKPTELTARERSQPLSAARECNLERLNGTAFTGATPTVARTGSVRLSGWVVDAGRNIVPPTVDLRLVNKTDNRVWKAEGQTGGARADVRSLLGGSAAFANPGFAVTLDPSALPPGTYRAYVVFDGGSGAKACDNGRAITIE